MEIKILDWEYKNIRRMNELKVNLKMSDGSVYPNTLLMMSNGGGKTTTLHLIRAALSGNATKWDEKKVRAYRPMGTDIEEGSFKIRIKFDKRIYSYILHLDYEEGRAWYETSSVESNGCVEEHDLPYALRGIMDYEGFVERFIFDGEQSKKILNSGCIEAENAIVYLYQLNKLDELIKAIDRVVEERTVDNTGKPSDRSVKILKGKVDRWKDKYNKLIKEANNIQEELDQMSSALERQKNRYEEIVAQDQELQKELERLQEAERKGQEDIRKKTAELLEATRKPYELNVDIDVKLKGLVDNLQTLKLPKTTAREFFNELALSRECICGRCIGDKERKRILENAEQYLGEESLVVVHSIKNALREYKRKNSCMILKELLENQLSAVDGIRAAIDRFANRLEKKGHEDPVKIQEEIKELNAKITEKQQSLMRLTAKDLSDDSLSEKNNIYRAEQEWKKARDTYYEASGTYKFAKKADKLKEYVKHVRDNTLNRLKSYMVRETNRKLEALIDNDKIEIRKIDGYLVLEGKDGASEGQTLAVAYAYIGTLFEHSPFEFPFVVDSPAASMDLSVRREVAEILPKLFEQTVIFVTSGERSGFAEVFFKRDDVQYLTVKGEKNEAMRLYNGKEVFEIYQENEERKS